MVLPVARKGSGALVAARVEQPNTGRGLAPVQLALGDGTERGIENRREVDDRVLHRDVDVRHDDEQRLGPYGWARPGQLRGDVVAVPATRVPWRDASVGAERRARERDRGLPGRRKLRPVGDAALDARAASAKRDAHGGDEHLNDRHERIHCAAPWRSAPVAAIFMTVSWSGDMPTNVVSETMTRRMPSRSTPMVYQNSEPLVSAAFSSSVSWSFHASTLIRAFLGLYAPTLVPHVSPGERGPSEPRQQAHPRGRAPIRWGRGGIRSRRAPVR